MIARPCNLCGYPRYYLVHQEKRKPLPAHPCPSGGDGQGQAGAYTISESHLEKPDKIVRCMNCGFVYAIPKEPLSELADDYRRMEDHEYTAEEKGRRKQARVILKFIRQFKNGGKMLDIGCGPGFFLSEAKTQGWRVQGVDLSAWARDTAAKRFNVEVFQGELSAARFPDKSFDAVVMNDVIEHLEDPKSCLREARRVLKNDGVLYLSTPDIDSALSRLLRARWWGINKYHLNYFSRRTLEKMFAETGFKSARYGSYPRVFSWNYWLKRLEAYPPLVRAVPGFIAGTFKLGDRLLSVTLHDQLGVAAKKLHTLDSLAFDERNEPAVKQKMKVVAVLPAYNAEKTLSRTLADIPREGVDEIILVDDASRDGTVALARRLGLTVYTHERNRGYGANQKTCYTKALDHGADVVVMCHPDYQYDPRTIPQLVEPILRQEADAVFGSRMMKGGALEGGMPLWKHNANVLLTAFENVMLGTYLTEYHSGFRAYSAKALRSIRFEENSDGFLFDTEIIVQLIIHHFKITEIPIRTRYFEEASSIRLWPSILYGLGIVRTMGEYVAYRRGWNKPRKFGQAELRSLKPDAETRV